MKTFTINLIVTSGYDNGDEAAGDIVDTIMSNLEYDGFGVEKIEIEEVI